MCVDGVAHANRRRGARRRARLRGLKPHPNIAKKRRRRHCRAARQRALSMLSEARGGMPQYGSSHHRHGNSRSVALTVIIINVMSYLSSTASRNIHGVMVISLAAAWLDIRQKKAEKYCRRLKSEYSAARHAAASALAAEKAIGV